MSETFDVNAPIDADGLVRLTALQMAERLRAGTTTSVELVQAHLDRIAAVDGDPRAEADTDPGVRAYLHVNTHEALAVAAEVDAIRAAGGAEAEALHPLAGVPVALKDNIVTASKPTTAASKVLSGFTSPFDATVVKLLQNAGASIQSKASLDEFGMGSHSQSSYPGPVQSPFTRNGESLSPGGSSGGSAVAVANGEAWA